MMKKNVLSRKKKEKKNVHALREKNSSLAWSRLPFLHYKYIYLTQHLGRLCIKKVYTNDLKYAAGEKQKDVY